MQKIDKGYAWKTVHSCEKYFLFENMSSYLFL